MEFEPTATIDGSPKFIVRVLSALRDLKCAQQSGSSALQIAEYICDHYEHDGDVLSQVQTALKRALCNKMVKLNRNKMYMFSGPIASNMQNKKRMTCKTKKLRGIKCRKKQRRKVYKMTVRKAGFKQSIRIIKSTCRRSRATNTPVKDPECFKFVLLDWLKLTWTKFRRKCCVK